MPAPAVTCLLIAAILLAVLVSPAAGIMLAIFCAVIEFFLPALTPEERDQ